MHEGHKVSESIYSRLFLRVLCVSSAFFALLFDGGSQRSSYSSCNFRVLCAPLMSPESLRHTPNKIISIDQYQYNQNAPAFNLKCIPKTARNLIFVFTS